ncbi:MAG TPA: YbjQ family protein [Streptosporangiaceae bacterium]|jgi:uncharacterized protein YbjQ (UPF0145 family)|nr:YbjQ family protein [Streptosporangiaceae bacterium]
MSDQEVPGRDKEEPLAVPAMPVIQTAEQYTGVPFVLVDGLARTAGWQWLPEAKGGPVFMIVGRGVMGGYKVLERFPLTADGWARTWQNLAAADANAAGKVLGALRAREAAALRASMPRPEPDLQPILIVTTNEIPGYRITQVHGDVFGLTVRVRSYFASLGTSFQGIVGGEVASYTRLLIDSRNQARERMWREARGRGANAIVAMRFDCNEIGGIMSEIAAYGTAVTAEPVDTD